MLIDSETLAVACSSNEEPHQSNSVDRLDRSTVHILSQQSVVKADFILIPGIIPGGKTKPEKDEICSSV